MRSGQNFARPMLLELPFYTPLFELFDWRENLSKWGGFERLCSIEDYSKKAILFYFIYLFLLIYFIYLFAFIQFDVSSLSGQNVILNGSQDLLYVSEKVNNGLPPINTLVKVRLENVPFQNSILLIVWTLCVLGIMKWNLPMITAKPLWIKNNDVLVFLFFLIYRIKTRDMKFSQKKILVLRYERWWTFHQSFLQLL